MNTCCYYPQHCTQRKAPVCKLLRGDFEVFRPTGATRCTNEGEIWHCTKFHPHRYNDKSIGPPKLKILLKFDQTLDINSQQEAYPLRDVHEICRICTSFHSALVFAIGWICSRGYEVMEILSWGVGFPHIFSAPSSETMHRIPKHFRGAGTWSRFSITVSSLVRLGFHPPPGRPKTFLFCLSVCLSFTMLNVRDCAPDFAMKALEYRNDLDAVG